MTVMQSQWKQECIETNLRFEPSRTLFGTTTKHRAFTGMVMYTWTSVVGESPRATLGADRIPTEANNYGGANFLAFSNPRFDADIAASETELDPAKAQGGLVRHAAHLCRRAAGAAALHQRHPAGGAEMAEGLRPERHRAALHPAGGALAPRVAQATSGAVAGAMIARRTTSRTLRPPRLSPGTTMRR